MARIARIAPDEFPGAWKLDKTGKTCAGSQECRRASWRPNEHAFGSWQDVLGRGKTGGGGGVFGRRGDEVLDR